MKKGAILGEAKNPGDASTAIRGRGFRGGIRSFVSRIESLHEYVTVTVATWVAAALVVAALLPPVLLRHGEPLAALAVIAFFSKLCHQRPDRALSLFGSPTAVCLRCLGIYAGAALGGLLRIRRDAALRGLLAALLLNVMDVAAESIGLHGNLPLLRLLIGAALGIAVGALFSSGLSLRKAQA